MMIQMNDIIYYLLFIMCFAIILFYFYFFRYQIDVSLSFVPGAWYKSLTAALAYLKIFLIKTLSNRWKDSIY